LWRGKGVDREYLLFKLREFHRVHKTPLETCVADMQQAFQWLPTSSYASEAKPLVKLTQKRSRGVVSIGELLVPLLIRLGAIQTDSQDAEENSTINLPVKTGETTASSINLKTSEARNSD